MNGRSRVAVVALTTATCAALGLTGLSPAGAATATTTPTATSSTGNSTARLDAIKARAAAAIAARVASLNRTIPAVTANAIITATDKATLLNTLDNDLSGLTALGQKIQDDTTVDEASTDYQNIFLDYRVYALALPQVRFAEAADDITATVVPRLNDADTTLAGLLSGVDSGKDTQAVQALMTDLGQQIAAATTATSGLSTTVLGYTPAQYDANHGLLDGPRGTLVGARTNIRKARTDIVTVLADLQ